MLAGDPRLLLASKAWKPVITDRHWNWTSAALLQKYNTGAGPTIGVLDVGLPSGLLNWLLCEHVWVCLIKHNKIYYMNVNICNKCICTCVP